MSKYVTPGIRRFDRSRLPPIPPKAERVRAAIAEMYAECRECIAGWRRDPRPELYDSVLGVVAHNRRCIREYRAARRR